MDGSHVLSETNGTTTIYYSYDADGTLLTMTYNGTEYIYVYNTLGDVSHLLDLNGNIVLEYKYDSYGNIVNWEDIKTNTLANINPYTYRGYRWDRETNLYYLNSRYYNPETGRFLNGDGMIQSSSSVLGNNLFTYTENNPVMNIDPSGYCYEIINSTDSNKTHNCSVGLSGFSSYYSGSAENLLSFKFSFSNLSKYYWNRKSTRVNAGHINANVAFNILFSENVDEITFEDVLLFLDILAQHNNRANTALSIFRDDVVDGIKVTLKISKIGFDDDVFKLLQVLKLPLQSYEDINVHLDINNPFDSKTAIGATLSALPFKTSQKNYFVYYYYNRYDYWRDFYDQ